MNKTTLKMILVAVAVFYASNRVAPVRAFIGS